jgi:D-arabinose 1-dehydrogenase-like Zn-dependent alcohol dehydrogenase
MKSAVFYGKHQIKVEETKIPEVGDNDVLIKVMACGICGTDVHIYEGDKYLEGVCPLTKLGTFLRLPQTIALKEKVCPLTL